jgi:Ca2+-binding RTX toxin-like protein
MSYSIAGTGGNDTLDQSVDSGPGTIVGLAGNDCLFAGAGFVSLTGESGNDTIVLKSGNTGAVYGGSENDSIVSNRNSIGPNVPSIGAMQLFGGDGADSVDVVSAAGVTIVGGDSSNDGPDVITSSGGASDFIFGNGGNDTVHDDGGNNTIVAGFGNDSLLVPTGSSLVFGNQGSDTIVLLGTGADTVFAGSGEDSVRLFGGGLLFGNEGGDTVFASGQGYTIIGGNDSADGNDFLNAFDGASILFGNGGDDVLRVEGGANTVIGGVGNDAIAGDALIFANEGNDTIVTTGPGAIVFAGLGNDCIVTGSGADSIQGNEGDDGIRGSIGVDTISGGSGSDVFAYFFEDEDGDSGGQVERITDVDFAADRFDARTPVSFAANVGAGAGGTLAAAANSAIASAYILAGGSSAGAVVAVQFTFSGRTYLAIDQLGFGLPNFGSFVDGDDLLVDITGATGTITTNNFI